jgi:hypothetical protein
MPVTSLLKVVFERSSPSGRAISLAVQLVQTIKLLNVSIVRRNLLVDDLRSTPRKLDDLMSVYFGIPSRAGNVIDVNYPIPRSTLLVTQARLLFPEGSPDKVQPRLDQIQNTVAR